MNHRILICCLFVSLLGPRSVDAQDFRQVAERPYSTGAITVLESSASARIQISGTSLPNCSSEMVTNPPRLVIDCAGMVLSNKSALVVPDNKFVKRLRFGRTKTALRIVADLIEPKTFVENTVERKSTLFTISASELAQPTVAVTIIPVSAPTTPSVTIPPTQATPTESPIKSTPSASATLTPLTAATVASKGTIIPEKAPVYMTAVPAPVLSRGETMLASFAFTTLGQPAVPTLKFKFWDKRSYELSRASPSKYILKVNAAKASSPIFLTSSTAPDGFAPFSKVSISQDSPKESASSLVVEIELSAAATLEVKQNGGEMIVSVAK